MIRLGKKTRFRFGSFVIEELGDHQKDIGCPRTEGNDIKSLHIFLMILLRHIFSTIYDLRQKQVFILFDDFSATYRQNL